MSSIKEALQKLREDNIPDEIAEIVNPYTGDKAKGFEQALGAIAGALFGDPQESQGQPAKPDPRMKPLPVQPKSKPSDNQKQDNQENQENSQNSQEKDSKDNAEDSADKALTPKEIEELVDRVQKARNRADDVINDAGDKIDHSKADALDNKLDDLEQKAEDAETEADAKEVEAEANKIEARLKTIADFWEGEAGEKHRREAKRDSESRRASKEAESEVKQALAQAKRNARNRWREYEPMTVDEIVHNIVRTIKNQIKAERDSSWDRYNPRSDDLGYIAPGRYTAEKKKKPKVVFYFDISGYWCNDDIKIGMGHRIEEALKALDQKDEIELYCFYFGTKVWDHFHTHDQGNSDAPIPHAINLLEAGELDNVIIMTDNNPHSNEVLNVPGYAWLLFYDTISESLATNVSGDKGTKIVMIEH